MRNFKFVSIKKKILTIFLSTAIISFLLLSFFLLLSISNSVEQIIIESGSDIVDISSKQISEWFSKQKKFIELLANSSTIKNMDFKEIIPYLKSIKHIISEDFESIFIVDSSGNGKTDGNIELDFNNRDYFNEIKNGLPYYTSNPIISRVSGELVFVFAYKVEDENGNFTGIIGAAINLNRITEITNNLKIDNIGYGFILDGNGTLIVHPERDLVLNFNLNNWKELGFKNFDETSNKILSGKKGNSYIITPDNVTEFIAFTPIPSTPGWTLGIAANSSELKSDIHTLTLNITISIVIISFVFIILSIYLGNSIGNPINILASKIIDFGKGDLNIDFEIKTNDEIGKISNSLQVMANEIKQSMIEINNISNNVKNSSEELSEISKEGKNVTENLLLQTERINLSIHDTSSAIEEASSGIEEIAASSQHISQSTQNLDSEIKNTETAIHTGLSILQKQKDRMIRVDTHNNKTLNIVEQVAQKTKNVQDILNTISSIAEQTNLLALNAAIEAARAGEAGKGFAVVAEEIRKLAEESKKSSKNITKILYEIMNSSNEAYKASKNSIILYDELNDGANAIFTEFENITKLVKSVNDRIEILSSSTEEQSASTEEMAAAMDSSSRSMIYVTEIITEINSKTEKLTEDSRNTLNISKNLNSFSEIFENLLQKFKI